jgi:uncharacterized delta-60 repeat protein
MRYSKLLLIVNALFLLAFTTLSQSGEIDLTFNSGDVGYGNGADNNILVSSVQSDGKIIVSGMLTKYNEATNKYIVRINPNGSLDSSFNTGLGATNLIRSFSVQSDGKIVIGGTFTFFNGTAINRIARLNSDGTLDTSFNPGSGANGNVTTIAIQNDGKVVICGAFTSFNGVSRNRIARLNSDGTLDLSFNPGTGFDNTVNVCSIQIDGTILIGGQFSSFDGISRNRIARISIDGTIDNSFNPGTGFNNIVNSLTIQNDDKIIVGGNFTIFDGATKNNIVRINPNGTIDTNFDTGTGTNGAVYSTCIQSDGQIIIGGDFTDYNGIQKNYIIRTSQNGLLDNNFNLSDGPNDYVTTISLQNDAKIIIGGAFTTFDGIARNYLSRLNTDGTLDFGLNGGSGADSWVLCSSVQNDDKVIIGGTFTTYNSTPVKRIARLNVDGTLDVNYNTGTGANSMIESCAIQSDGKVIIAGQFTSFNGVALNRIARLNIDGTIDLSFNIGLGFNGNVGILKIQSDGKIVVSGSFTSFDGSSVNKLVRLNVDGTLDNSFITGTGVNNSVLGISIQNNDKIIICGVFTSYNGVSRNRIARLNSDGTLDLSFNPGTGGNSSISLSAIQEDGKIIIGGAFNSFNGIARNKIARLNSDGSVDNLFNPGILLTSTSVNSILIQSDSKILIGGEFISYSPAGDPLRNITRINANGTIDYSFNPNGEGAVTNSPSIPVRTILIQSDSKIVIGGGFTSYNGVGRNRVARIHNNIIETSSISANEYCGGANILVPFSSTGFFYPDNIFTAQISDETGSFNNPIDIGSLPSTVAGTVNATIPTFLATDSNYRIRIVSSNPVTIGSDNGSDISIFSTSSSSIVNACDSYTWSDGITYSVSGLYSQTNLNIFGCDSISTLDLTINPSTVYFINVTACGSYSLNTTTYTSSGTYNQIITNSFGCDSTITLSLIITNSTDSIFNVTACDSFTLNAITYTSGGTYFQTLTNSVGCDSLITLNLIINNTSSILNISSCNSFTLNDSIYSSSGSYIQIISNSVGCDSIITLNLTINNTSSILNVTSCNSFTLNDSIYFSSGSYTQTISNSVGCDSIITLNLTINNSSDSIMNITECDSFTLNNITYTSTGTYNQIIPNTVGCDSTITLNLNIIPSITLNVNNTFTLPSDEIICTGLLAIDLEGNLSVELEIDANGTTYNSTGYSLIADLCSGIHDLQLTDQCNDTIITTFVIAVDSNFVFNNDFIDSLAQDSLGITLTNCDIFYNGITDAYIDSIWAVGNTANVIWNIVDSNGSNYDTTSYELNNGNGVYWLQLSVFCPNKAFGEYFTVTEAVYFQNGSISLAGIDESSLNDIRIYPNPTLGSLIIEMPVGDGQLKVYDTQGKLIFEQGVVSSSMVSLLNMDTGVYFFEVTTEYGTIVKRIIKQ